MAGEPDFFDNLLAIIHHQLSSMTALFGSTVLEIMCDRLLQGMQRRPHRRCLPGQILGRLAL
jgi:hypothetical protein